jgi:hypothetical protein
VSELEIVNKQIDCWHEAHNAHMAPGMPGAYTKARRRALNIQLDRLCERRAALASASAQSEPIVPAPGTGSRPCQAIPRGESCTYPDCDCVGVPAEAQSEEPGEWNGPYICKECGRIDLTGSRVSTPDGKGGFYHHHGKTWGECYGEFVPYERRKALAARTAEDGLSRPLTDIEQMLVELARKDERAKIGRDIFITGAVTGGTLARQTSSDEEWRDQITEEADRRYPDAALTRGKP